MRRSEAEFLPAVLEIQESPPSPLGRAVLVTIVILFAAGIAELGAFTHFTWRAIIDSWLDNDAESWHEYIQNIQFPRPPQWWVSPEPDNQFLGRFKLTVLIEYRVPRRP